jgi:hypothetical protein
LKYNKKYILIHDQSHIYQPICENKFYLTFFIDFLLNHAENEEILLLKPDTIKKKKVKKQNNITGTQDDF